MNKHSNLVNNVNQKFNTNEKKTSLEVDTIIHFSAEQYKALNRLCGKEVEDETQPISIPLTVNRSNDGKCIYYYFELPGIECKHILLREMSFNECKNIPLSEMPFSVTVSKSFINIANVFGRVEKVFNRYDDNASDADNELKIIQMLFNLFDKLDNATKEDCKEIEEKIMFTQTKEAKLSLDASKINLINEALGGCIDVNVADKPIVFNYTIDEEGDCIGYKFSMPTVYKDEITGEVINVDVSVDTLGYTFKTSDGCFNGQLTTYGKVTGKEIHNAANYLISLLETFKTVEEFNNINIESELVKYLSEEELYLLKRLSDLEPKVKKKALPVFHEFLEDMVFCMLNSKKKRTRK